MGEPIQELGGRTWDELEVVEHSDGKLMFPAKLRKRDARGVVKAIPVRVRVPAPLDMVQARPEAIAWAATLKIDRDRDKDVFEQLEQICLLARAIRTAEEPYPQYTDAQDLASHDESSLQDIQEQLNAFKAALDPRASALTEEDVWRLIVAVAKESTITPLVELAGREQPTLVVRMALEACRSPTGRHWLQSFGISIPDSSASTTTPES